jgi:hypothetical protein
VTVAHVLLVVLLTLSLKANLYIKIEPIESTPLRFTVKAFFRPFFLDTWFII